MFLRSCSFYSTGQAKYKSLYWFTNFTKYSQWFNFWCSEKVSSDIQETFMQIYLMFTRRLYHSYFHNWSRHFFYGHFPSPIFWHLFFLTMIHRAEKQSNHWMKPIWKNRWSVSCFFRQLVTIKLYCRRKVAECKSGWVDTMKI